MLIESATISKYIFFVIFFSSSLLAQNSNSYNAKEISRDSLLMVSHSIIESATLGLFSICLTFRVLGFVRSH
jgi:hypothetical protein